MTGKEIFKEIWSIKDAEGRAERIRQLAEQDAELAATIQTLLQYSDQFPSFFDDPLILVDAQTEERQSTRYSIKSELAKGGMGVIYTAYDSLMRRDVVLKCLQLKHRDNFQAVHRFYNEAHITGQLQHPGIAPVYELGELQDGRPFYCMKLVEGETLGQFLAGKDSTAVDKNRALNFFLQICQTMAFAHERGVIHRDLKPSNIMVGDHGQTQIMDWGVAKKLAADDEHSDVATTKQTSADMVDGSLEFESVSAENPQDDLTRHGQIVGTPGYMSPEQAKGRNDLIDKQSDVYSLGAILCEILSGATISEARGHSLGQSESLLSECNQRFLDSNVELELADLARSCLQQEPTDRPSDAGAVAQKMLAYFELRETTARATQIRLEKELTRNEEARKRRLSFVICVVACLGILTAGIIGTSIGFYRANEARKLADQKAEDAQIAKDSAINAKIAVDDSNAKAEARLAQLTKVNEILGNVFEDLHPHKSAKSGEPLVDLLVRNLDQAAKQLDGNAIEAPDVIASFQTKIGKCYHAFGLIKKAIPLFEKVDRFAMSEYGIENIITRNARCRLADSLSADNQAKRANSLYMDLQEFHLRSNDTDSHEFLKIQYKLAANYLVMGEKKKAIELIEAYSERGLEVVGVEYGLHMAQVYNFNRMPKKTIKVLNFVFSKTKRFESNVGEINQSDPNVETAQMLLARAYLQLDQQREALPILEKLSPNFDAHDGHFPRSKSYNVSLPLARALQGVGRYRDSIRRLKKFLELTEPKSQSLHEQRISARYWLVEAYLKTGDFANALEAANKVHNDRVAKYGADHWTSALSAENLADVYLLINQPEKAKEYLDLAFAKNHKGLSESAEQRLARMRFKYAMLTAYREGLEATRSELEKANELLEGIDEKEFNAFPIYFDNLEPKIWLAESLALQGDKAAIQLIREFESKVAKRSNNLDELVFSTQQLYRACVARYVIKPDPTLLLRLKGLIATLKLEHLDESQLHRLEEANSLLGMTYLKLEKTSRAKKLLESSFASLQAIDNPLPRTSQATIDAGKRLAHFYLLTDANDDAERVSDSIKAIESSTEHIPAFSRALIDKTLTTDSK